MPSNDSKMESTVPKRQLFDDDASVSDDGGAPLELKVNEEYANRFEHNKKREERHRRKSITPISFLSLNFLPSYLKGYLFLWSNE